jgi:hypothetical protein
MPTLAQMIAAFTLPVTTPPARRRSERAVMPSTRPMTPSAMPRIGMRAAGIERIPSTSAAVARPEGRVTGAAARDYSASGCPLRSGMPSNGVKHA